MSEQTPAAARTAIQTALGPIAPEEAGITLPHEHLIADLTLYLEPPANPEAEAWAEQPFTVEHRRRILANCNTNRDNLRLDDPALMTAELRPFTEAGGRTLVDLTTQGLGPRPETAAEIARRSGVNVVLGAGYYIAEGHPPGMEDRSEEDIAAEIAAHITEGFSAEANEANGVRAGIIGEIGFQNGTPAEEKSLRGAALAQRTTGAALNVHVPFGPGREEICRRAADLLADAGADLSRVILSHQDLSIRDPEYQEAMLSRGVTLEIDCFGLEMTTQAYGGWSFPSDRERIAGAASLVERGWADQVLVSTDICMKFQLRAYGGRGFGYILDTAAPGMREAGVSEADLDKILAGNAKRLLTMEVK